MKNRWLLVILAASLALNLTAFAAFAYNRYRKWQRRGVLKRLTAGAPERIAPLIDEHQFKMDSLRMEYWRARRELAEMNFADKMDSQAIEQTLDRIAEIHREMNRLVLETGRKAVMLLPPGRRERIIRRHREMVGGPPPPPLRCREHPVWRPKKRLRRF
ncbi:MAG: hypothetical protein ABIK39_01870 [candidate division WOR-3 bacterium]